MVLSSEPTHLQTFFYLCNVALSSSIYFPFSFHQVTAPHLVLTSNFYLSWLIVIAIEEDYCRVVETFGYYIQVTLNG